jgi:hypothetical protein
VRADEVQADRLRIVAPDEVADGDGVAQRLRHLLGAHVDEAVVDPVAREGAAGHRLGLRDLALVVRKDQILPPAVDVEGLPEVLHRHGGALDVPAGPAGLQALPARLAGLGDSRGEIA